MDFIIKIVYILLCMLFVALLCPAVYLAFQFIFFLFGSTWDNLTDSNDYFNYVFS